MEENTVDDKTPLYRYYDLLSFLYLIGSKKLRFSKIKDWPDKFEGASYVYSEKIFNSDKQVKIDHVFGSCWTQEIDIKECYDSVEDYEKANAEIQEHGSGALWEQYCSSSGVRVKTTLGKILAKIDKFKDGKTGLELIHNKVQYSPGININRDTTDNLFHKRVPFRHECEYRFILIDYNKLEDNVEVSIGDPLDFFDEYLICPTTKNNKWIVNTIYQTLVPTFKDMKVNSKNGNLFCRKSQLYENSSNELGW
jgi:hypothetical protein